jgi:nucleotide-binding universal stress UspA family protein
MTQHVTVPAYAEFIHHKFAELLVAYDFSEAADSSLKYAVMLAKRFGSFIHLVGVQSPAAYAGALEAGHLSQHDLLLDLQELEARLRAEGLGCDSVRRIGNLSDTIEGLVLERKPDLLLLGAYGYGPSDRRHLGSTAEHLLRTIRCPALVIGPHALVHADEAPGLKRILCATSSLENPEDTLRFAGNLARQMKAELEIVHIIDVTQKNVSPKHNEQHCEEWAGKLRDQGITVSCKVITGRAEEAIAARAGASDSSLILFGLHRSGNKMVDCPDGVVSATIHQARCPVMAVPPAFAGK